MFKGATLQHALLICTLAIFSATCSVYSQSGVTANTNALLQPIEISKGWKLQDIALVHDSGDMISKSAYQPAKWYAATVPGTVLTTLVNNKVYPEPLYGENNRPDRIPESLARTSYWYRTTVTIPQSYKGKKIWLNFDGINYEAHVWVNGKNVGMIKGAFARGVFDITSLTAAGQTAAVAVKITPQPHPGTPLEQTIANGTGGNGGITAIDGPTFLSTIGWDWIPGIRDRDAGIWQKVFLSATGAVTLRDPYIRTKLPLPQTNSADLSVEVTLQNTEGATKSGVLTGQWGNASFSQPVTLNANETRVIKITPEEKPVLHVNNPKLWWPNGYGAQNLYTMKLRFTTNGNVSDGQDVTFGIRQFSYSVPNSENLTVSCNGVPVFCKGGNWGMDEAMKRIPRERLEANVRMHQLANFNIIRNWVGQSTSKDLYELCDKYGIMLWDEFFQPNPSDGPNPTDLPLYMANVREKILRFRNHCSIMLWCARNEGFPPKEIDEPLSKMLTELDGGRLYQPSSTSGRGVHSGGPYRWQPPVNYYRIDAPFKTEIGPVSVPTIESIHGFMPEKDWETVNDDWASHDFLRGAQSGDRYLTQIAARYGALVNLPDFVRKAQLANYEAHRALYEGRECQMFTAATGVIMWMSHPSQPSFVWQIYSYDLEPNASLFGVRKACEPVHIMFNQSTGHVQVINNLASAFNGKAKTIVYNMDGTVQHQQQSNVAVAPTSPKDIDSIKNITGLSNVYFVKATLYDAKGKEVSTNFYWHAAPVKANETQSLQDLNNMAAVTLQTSATRKDSDGKVFITVTIKNPSDKIALMTHLQLRRQKSGLRVLPVYYSDNYVSLVPGETKVITIEASAANLKGESPCIAFDGWNTSITEKNSSGVYITNNKDALVSSVPAHEFKMIEVKK